METYVKKFTQASLLYLLAGSTLGIFLGSDPAWAPKIRFVHIHFNLLGFMTMMIAGVSYHVLPRFNARPVPWPGGVKVQFYLQNIGLLGMAEEYMVGGLRGLAPFRTLFLIFAVITVAALFIMVYNLYGVLLPQKDAAEAEKIAPDWKVSAILDRHPQLLETFLEAGFSALANPAARQTLARAVSLEKACKMHGVDSREFVDRLNAKVGALAGGPPGSPAEGEHALGAVARRGEIARLDIMVGSLIKVYPETKAVFEKHYGAGCFNCPGQAFETVEQTAQMHGKDPRKVLEDLNAAIKESIKSK